jgi:hypothetical protein
LLSAVRARPQLDKLRGDAGFAQLMKDLQARRERLASAVASR